MNYLQMAVMRFIVDGVDAGINETNDLFGEISEPNQLLEQLEVMGCLHDFIKPEYHELLNQSIQSKMKEQL